MDRFTTIIIFIIALCCIFLLLKYVSFYRAKKFRQKLNSKFGEKPSRDNDFASISSYWNEKLSHNDILNYIDGITWDDLDMNKVFDRINTCNSSVGEEYLYSMLHEPEMNVDTLTQRETLMEYLSANPEARLDLQVILSKIGRENYNGLSSFCYDVNSKKLKRPYIYTVLACLPLLFTALLLLKSPVIILCLILSIITNGVVYYYISKRIVRGISAMRYFSAVLWGAGKIIAVCENIDNTIIENLKLSYNVFKKLGGSLSGIAQQRLTDIDFLIEYIRIIFLTNIRSYNKLLDAIEKNNDKFRLLFKCVGEVDALIAALSLRQSLPFYSLPVFYMSNELNIKDIYHLLLDNPIPNTVDITKSSLISGSNASGKSTFIKSVAINGIMAQTLHTCTAKLYQTRPALIMTSMAVRDNITLGESYFITEIKSLKRILKKIPDIFCICIIDEILRGTNTIERIAASASVLNYVSELDCLCIAATHDIELTSMLASRYDNYHFSEQITQNGISFDYIIKNGPSRTKNAIKLLEHMGFDESIIKSAQDLVQAFEDGKTWKL